jgi:hypothetical protein
MFATLAKNNYSLKNALITMVPSIVQLENACKENSSLLLLCLFVSAQMMCYCLILYLLIIIFSLIYTFLFYFKLLNYNIKFDKKFGKLLDRCAFVVLNSINLANCFWKI